MCMRERKREGDRKRECLCCENAIVNIIMAPNRVTQIHFKLHINYQKIKNTTYLFYSPIMERRL